MTQDDGIPATVLARSGDTVNLNAPGWGFWLLLGGCAWVLWRGVQRGARGMLGAIDPELDREWSLFYQSEMQPEALHPKFDYSVSAAEARARLLAKHPHALDEPGIEEGSPVAPPRIIKPSLKEQWRMEREGEEVLAEKKRLQAQNYYKRNRQRLVEYSRAYRAEAQETPEARAAFVALRRANAKARYARLSPEEKRERSRQARAKDPEKVRAYEREYGQREDVKAKRKEYYKAYAQTPEGKAKIAARQRARYARKKAERERKKAAEAELELRRRELE